MAEAADAPKRGGWVLGSSIVLVLLLGAYVGGLLSRPSIERQLLSGEESRTEGLQLKQRVESAMLLVEEKQRTETMRLTSAGRNSSSSGMQVSSDMMSAYDGFRTTLRDLAELKTSLARAEEGGWQSTVVRTLRPIILEKLAAVETSKSQ